ncbi:protein translocase subunit SecD [Arenicella sp. 4NH20-0111]|uniref:protein translocase subunit SecD n=1 Tax=Arenicella sp. 4NH20-0111 TaxID=3127648 RepID=UPI003103F5D0
MNRNPIWKYLALLLIVAFGAIYAIPNLYQAAPGIQVIGDKTRNIVVDEDVLGRVNRTLSSNDIAVETISLSNGKIKARLKSESDQTKAREVLRDALGRSYPVAITDHQTTPSWLQSLGGAPMYLGLDLRGGVHFLLQVDMAEAEKKASENYLQDIKSMLRKNKLYNEGVAKESPTNYVIRFKESELRDKALVESLTQFRELQATDSERDGKFLLTLSLTEKSTAEIRKAALKKNIEALRNRVDQLGVSEPVIQQQGLDRIVVQLPGVKDPQIAKEILGKTATLEVKLVDEDNAIESSVRGRVPAGSQRYKFRDGRSILLKKRLLYSGDNIIDASAGIDQQGGGQVVHITLDSKGSAINSDVTGKNIGKRMAVVYVEIKNEPKVDSQGKPVLDSQGNEIVVKKRIEEVITAPVIRDQLGKKFQITGVNEPGESQSLALLLRAGSLAAPVYIVEERTVGPSLGAENIEKGFKSVLYGFLAVLFFMVVYYRLFGTVASFALCLNLVIIVAVLSLLQATLTLPGVAGMVLTVGMAVDANVLIFERIREELKAGSTPQLAIHRGYDNAFSTIIDANLTTLIAALVLFNFGTGPIQGFAITLSIGIATSMLTAIFVSRILVNFCYGKRRLDTLAI